MENPTNAPDLTFQVPRILSLPWGQTLTLTQVAHKPPPPSLLGSLLNSPGGPDSQRVGNSLPGVRTPRSGNIKPWLPFLEGKGRRYLSIVFADIGQSSTKDEL